MTIYKPGSSQHYGGGSRFGPTTELLRMQQQNINMEILTGANPWLADDPTTLLQLANSGLPPEELANNAAAMAGIEGLDRMAQNLTNLDPIAQRSVYSTLTEQQQRGLQEMGWEPGQTDLFGGNALSNVPILGGAMDAVGGALGTATGIAMKPLANTVAPVFGHAFNALIWLSDVPAHFYRAIRQMEGWQQWLAVGGAALAVGLTGGAALGAVAGAGTLMSAGVLGGVALAGATAATLPTAITNRTEWWDMMNPWGSTGIRRGERIFSKGSQDAAMEVLGGAEHINAMARDVAANMDAYDFAQEFAGVANASHVGVMTESIERVAAGMAEPGTEAYQIVFKGLNDLVEMPEFRQAVENLNDGKISFGRDIAQTFQLNPGDKFYGIVSGAADAAWLLTMDPTMAIGKIGALRRMTRRGMAYDGSTEATTRLGEILETNTGVRHAVEQFAKGMNDDNFELIPRAYRSLHGPVQEWMEANGKRTFSKNDFLEFIGDGHNFERIMEGGGTVKGLEQIVMSPVNRSQGMGRWFDNVRRFQEGMTDEVYEAQIRREARKQGDDVAGKLDHDFPADYHEQAMDMTWQPVIPHPDTVTAMDAYSNGRSLGHAMAYVPGGRSLGRFIGSISTMTPANKMMMMTGPQSVEDIPRFVETMGRHFQMNSKVRKAWLNEIMSKGSVSQRRQVTYSFMNNLFEVGGMNATQEGRELAARYMMKYKQAFGNGASDVIDAGGLTRNVGHMPGIHQADALLVPNLREMARISRHGILIKNVSRLTDHQMLEGMMSRYIKPGWLLRIGFIPRNAGEEMLAFGVRMTEGGIAQEFAARNVGTRRMYKEIYRKLHDDFEGVMSKLSDDEIRILQRDVVPTHVKPLAAIGRRTGWAPLQQKSLQEYGQWLAGKLEDGFIGWTPDKNMSQWKRDLLLGRNHSVRSLLTEGVDQKLVTAGELWTMRHSDAIMKSVSSLNNSVFERARVNPNSTTMALPNREGIVEDVAVVMTGERGKVRFGDMRYSASLHHQMTEWLHDERIAGLLADFSTRLWTHGDGLLQKANVVDAVTRAREVQGFAHQTFMLEMLDWLPDNVAAAAEKFDNFPEFAAGLRAAARSTDDDHLSVLIQEMKNHARSHGTVISEIQYGTDDAAKLIERNQRTEMVDQLADKMETLRPLYEGLDALSPSERSWMSAMITRDNAKPMDMASLEMWARGESVAPKFTLYRGVPDSRNAVELPNGDLLIRPTKQDHLGARTGVSMTTDPVQAGVFTRGPKGKSSIDVQTGTVLEIDGDWALANHNMTKDELLGNARNYNEGNPSEEYGLGMWGKPDQAATEVTWLSDTDVVIPKGKWRAQSVEETTNVRFKADEATSPSAAALKNEMSPNIGGYQVQELVEDVREPLERFIADMPPELRAQLSDLLTTDSMEWKRYFDNMWDETPPPMPRELIDFAPFGESWGGTAPTLEQYLTNWLAQNDRLAGQLHELDMRVGGFADYFREELGLPTVKSLDPTTPVSSGYRADQRSAIRQLVETDFSIRGKGGFTSNIDGWAPMYDDFGDWEKALENEIYQTLARPENADVVRQSDWMLQGESGQPVALPPAEGVSRLYQPVVPRDIGHLDSLLESPRFQPVLEKEIQESLGTLARALDNPRLPKAQQTIWGEIQHLALTTIDDMPAGTHPINRQAQATMDAIRNGRSPQEVQKALSAGEQLTSNPHIYEQAERVISASTRNKTWDDVATEIIGSPRAVAFADDTIRAMSQDEKIAIVSRALRQIQSNKAYYSQPIITSLEQMAFDSPSVARWLTSVISDGPLDELASARVGQIDVARSAIQTTGEWHKGVRLASVDNGTGVGRFWQLDDTHRGASVPVDAQTVHWFGRGEHKALGTERMVEHGNFVVGDGYDAALMNWSKKIRENWVASQRRGLVESVEVTSDRVARRGLNGGESVPKGERLELQEDYYEIMDDGSLGAALDYGDTRHFQSSRQEMEDDLMWNILGPAVRDHFEAAGGHSTKVIRRNPRKGKPIKVDKKITDEMLGGEDIVTMTRSRVEQIKLEGDAVPNLTVSKNFDRLADTRWDRMVRLGFNKVIGPVMDSMSRKPMSFHYFAQAYSQHMEALPWMLDTQLFRNQIPEQFGDLLHLFAGETNLSDAERLGVRAMAKLNGDDLSNATPSELKEYVLSLGRGADGIKETLLDAQTSLRGVAVQREVDAGVDTSRGIDISKSAEWADSKAIGDLLDGANFDMLRYGIDSPGLGHSNSERLIEFYHDTVPDEIWEEGMLAVKGFLDEIPGVFSEFTPDQWRVLLAGRNNLKHTMDIAEDTAAIRAIDNVVPFLDSHEQRSMMAEYGRNWIPFWYAQENFIKRWARTMSTSPVWGADQLRKMQLMYLGLKSVGTVRTDPNGKDWVVYPGSGLLVEAMGAIPGMDHKPLGVLFQASTDSMLPGIEAEMGTSSLAPFVSMPVHLVTHFFPETKEMKRNLLGDIGASRSIMSQFVPGVAQNMWSALFEDEQSNARYASAMITAVSMAEAEGRGLKEGATAYEVDEYLDELRNHARVILFAQAITGYISPGAPSSIATGEDVGSFGWFSGIGVESPGMLASNLYRQYMSNLGPEEGTVAYINAFPKLDLEDVVNPLAFTQSASDSISKAPLPATEKGMAWYNSNKGWIDAQPEAGAWFLPTDDDSADFDYYSYSQQFVNGLRKRKSPAEFITAMKYRIGAQVYFEEKEKYEEAQEAIGPDNSEGLAKAKIIWDDWKSEYLTAHPIFAEEIQSGDSRVRRDRTIDQLRYAVNDPNAPDSPHLEAIKAMVYEYDRYQAAIKTYKYDRTADGQERKRQIKLLFEDWAENWKRDNPQLDRLWSSVYKPEANL